MNPIIEALEYHFRNRGYKTKVTDIRENTYAVYQEDLTVENGEKIIIYSSLTYNLNVIQVRVIDQGKMKRIFNINLVKTNSFDIARFGRDFLGNLRKNAELPDLSRVFS
jgi:hypothetical protein